MLFLFFLCFVKSNNKERLFNFIKLKSKMTYITDGLSSIKQTYIK